MGTKFFYVLAIINLKYISSPAKNLFVMIRECREKI